MIVKEKTNTQRMATIALFRAPFHETYPYRSKKEINL